MFSTRRKWNYHRNRFSSGFTAIEDTVYEVKKAKELGIPIIKKLTFAMIAKSKNGCSCGNFWKINHFGDAISNFVGCRFRAVHYFWSGFNEYYQTRKNWQCLRWERRLAHYEADESDVRLFNMNQKLDFLLNVDKDHQEIEELMDLFFQKEQSKTVCCKSIKCISKKLCRRI